MAIEWCAFTQCPLCGQPSFRERVRLRSLQVSKCPACGMMFLNPYASPGSMAEFYSTSQSMIQANERLRHYYDRFEGSETERFYEHCLQVLGELKGGGNLLDIACGRGQFLSLAKRAGWRVTGVEPAEEHAEYAEREFGIEVVKSSFEEAELNGRAFDVITLWDFIEHVPNPREVVAKAARWLEPEGCLLIATPNHESLVNFLAELIYFGSGRSIEGPLSYFFVPEHVLYFTPSTLQRLVADRGLSVVKDIRSGTDIDRYALSPLTRWTAKVLLFLSRILRSENRMVFICRKTLTTTDR